MSSDMERILSGLVRHGIVTDVDNEKHMARVKYQGENMTSGWLYVLNNRPFIPSYDGEQVTGNRSGGGGYAAYESHNHPLTILQWMPKVNDKVLVLYLPVANADGFILGGFG